MKRFKLLGQRGFTHHMILLLLIVGSVSAFGAYKVIYSKADTNTYTFRKPNGCFPGKTTGPEGGCKLYNKIENVRDDCAQYRLQFNGSSCEARCIAGWYIGTDGQCNQLQNPPSGGGGGGQGGGGSGGGGETPTPPTEAECAELKRLNNDKTNNRCEACYAAFQDGDGNENTYKDACVKKTVSPVATEGSGGGGSGGGNNSSAGNGGNKGSNNNGNGNGNGSNNGGSNDNNQEVIARCAAKKLEYNSNNNSCGTRCVGGYSKTTNGVCVEGVTLACQGIIISDGTCVGKNKVEEYCKNFKLAYNANRNSCSNKCVNENYVMTDGVCAKKGTDPIKDPPVLTLDTSMDRKTCDALGRQWESGTKNANSQKIKGCSTNACDTKSSSIIANAADGAPYCSGYISKNEKATCENKLHRNWMAVAKGCMQNPKAKKAGSREANAPQCQKQYSTYVWRDAADECMDPNVVDQVKAVAQATGKPFLAVAHMSQAQICNLQPGKHWNGKKCVADKPAITNGSGGQQATGGEHSNPSGQNGGGDTAMSSSPVSTKAKCNGSPYFRVWSDYASVCAKDGRSTNVTGSKYPSSAACVGTGGRTTYLVQDNYDRCVQPSTAQTDPVDQANNSPAPATHSSQISINGNIRYDGARYTFVGYPNKPITLNVYVTSGLWKFCAHTSNGSYNCNNIGVGTHTYSSLMYSGYFEGV